MKPIDIEVARKIRKRRLELKLTQEQVAKKLGVTRGNVTQFEMGRNKIKHNTLRKYAEILKKPVSYFVGDESKYFSEIKLRSNPEELTKIVDKWKINEFLKNINASDDFIDDLELTLEYLCELYNLDMKKIWNKDFK